MLKHKKAIFTLGIVLVIVAVAVIVSNTKHQPPKPSSSLTISNLSSDNLKQLSQYNNKIVTIKGSVVRIGNSYYVAGTGKNPAVQQLDFSQIKASPDSYVFGKQTTYTISGKLTRSTPKTPYVLQVQSIK